MVADLERTPPWVGLDKLFANESPDLASPLTDNLGKDDSSCNRKVERFYPPGSGDLDQLMATISDGMAEALAFTPQDEHHIPFPVKMIEGLLRFSGCTDNPETFSGEKVQCPSQIDHLGNGQGSVGSGGSLEKLACDLRRPVFGQDQAVHAKEGCCSDKGPEISFIGDVICHDKKSIARLMTRPLDQVFEIRIRERLCKSNETLVGGSRHDGFYFMEIFELNRNTLLRSEPDDLLGPCPLPARPNPDFAQPFRGTDKTLPDRVKAGDQREMFFNFRADLLSPYGCLQDSFFCICPAN
jgi:hypothetical protein